MYQALSPDGRQSEIELGHYLSQIASSLMNAYAAEGIRLDIKVDHTPTSINVALPVGLIVNKLMTNAFKYAFADKPGGTITLHCLRQEDPERYCVMVGDDSMGLPEGGRWPVPGKIGALIEQALHENTKAGVVVAHLTSPQRTIGCATPTSSAMRFGRQSPIQRSASATAYPANYGRLAGRINRNSANPLATRTDKLRESRKLTRRFDKLPWIRIH